MHIHLHPPRLAARCPLLTAAGGQGPQGNTAYDPANIRSIPSRLPVLKKKKATDTLSAALLFIQE